MEATMAAPASFSFEIILGSLVDDSIEISVFLSLVHPEISQALIVPFNLANALTCAFTRLGH